MWMAGGIDGHQKKPSKESSFRGSLVHSDIPEEMIESWSTRN